MSIICPRHGRVSMWPQSHLNGTGCPNCSRSVGELKVERFLKQININFITEYAIPYEGNKSGKTYIDFYLPDLNTFIEFNGQQHYIPCERFGGQVQFEQQVQRDKYVENYCKEKGINLVIIKYNEDVNDILNQTIEI